MRKISIVVAKALLNNNIFTDLPPLDFDNYLHHQRLLKSKLLEAGYDLATCDINKIEDAEVVFYYDTVMPLPKPNGKQKNYLFLWESEVISPTTYDIDIHRYFDKIFTWKDSLITEPKYVKINYSHEIIKNITVELIKKEKLLTLIAGNKNINHPLELYSKRVEAIRWFEKNHPDEFDLYGRGWDRYNPSNKYIRFIYSRFSISRHTLQLLCFKRYFSFRGEVDAKIPILSKYKFAICYENAYDISGYITEKIFHCFFAGCIPIYWGADDITDYIPENCFIDKRKFNTYEQLYTHIKNMSDIDYLDYLANIELFLNSPQVEQFSAENFVNTVISEVVNEK